MVKHTKYVLSILVVTALLMSPSISAVTMTQGMEDTSSETIVSSGGVPSTSLADITSTSQSETSETQTEATEEEDSNPVEKIETISDDSTTDTKTTTDGNWTYNTNTNTNTYELLSYEGSDVGTSDNPVTIPAGTDGHPFLITKTLTASLKEKNVRYLAIATPSTDSGGKEACITSGESLFKGMNLVSLDLTHLNTTGVTNMAYMFNSCVFCQSITLTNLDTSSVTNMKDMFSTCTSLKSLDLTSFDTSLVNSMTNMFNDCRSLQSVDISSFTTGESTSPVNLQSMFYGCGNLINISIPSNGAIKAGNMNRVFANTTKLNSVDCSFLNTENTTNMGFLFAGCSNLINIQFGEYFKTDNVTSLEYMFYSCRSLKAIDISQLNLNYLGQRVFDTGSSELLVISSSDKVLAYDFTSDSVPHTPPTSTTLTATDGYAFKDGATEHQYLVDMGKENGNNGCAITPEQATAQGVKDWLTAQRPSVDDYYKMTSTVTDDLWETENVTNLSFEDALKSTYDLIEGKVTVTVPSTLDFGSEILTKDTKYLGKTKETLTVTDNRYSHSDWDLRVSCSPFTGTQYASSVSSAKLTSASLTPNVSDVQVGDVALTSDGTQVSLATYNGNRQDEVRTATLTWGEKTLSFPDVKKVRADDYRATLTWTLSDTP